MTLLFLTFIKSKKLRSVTIHLPCKTISTSPKGIPQCTTKVQPLHSRHSRCSTKWHGGPRRQLDTTRLIHIKASKMRSKAPHTGRFFYAQSAQPCCSATICFALFEPSRLALTHQLQASLHGMDSHLSRFGAGRFCGRQCGRRRADSGASHVCSLPYHHARHAVWHQ